MIKIKYPLNGLLSKQEWSLRGKDEANGSGDSGRLKKKVHREELLNRFEAF